MNAQSVSVIGSWAVPPIGEIEEMDEGQEGESELQSQEREEENEIRSERVFLFFFYYSLSLQNLKNNTFSERMS